MKIIWAKIDDDFKLFPQGSAPLEESWSQLVCPPEKSLSPRPWKSHYLSWSTHQKSHYPPGLEKVIISAGLPPRKVIISAGLPPRKVIIPQALEKSLSQLVCPPEKSLSPRPWKSHYLSWSAPQKSHYPPGLGKVIISAGLPPRKVIISQALEKSLSQLACPPKKSLSQLVCHPEKSLSPRPWKSHYLSWSAPQKSHYPPGLGKVIISAGLPPRKVIIPQALEKSLSQLVCPPEKSLSPRPWKSHYLSWSTPQKSHYLSWSALKKSHYPPGLGKVIISAGLPPRKVIISAGLPPRKVIIPQALEKSLSLILVWLIWGGFRPDPKSKVIIPDLGLVDLGGLSTRPKVKSHYPWSWSGWFGGAFDQTQSQKSLSLILVWLIWGGFRPDPKSKVIIPPSWSGCYGPAFGQTQSQKSLSFSQRCVSRGFVVDCFLEGFSRWNGHFDLKSPNFIYFQNAEKPKVH